MANITTISFNQSTPREIRKIKYGVNWPVVYILSNGKEVYIGETTNASIRVTKHLANKIRKNLKQMTIITEKTFNKSVILDLEAFLIKYMSADNLFKLQNGNAGLQNHNYYQKELYEAQFKEIWTQLKKMNLVKHNLQVIRNINLFKYSPYKSLSVDQYLIANDILKILSDDIENHKKSTCIICGGAGTGKTILAIYFVKLLIDAVYDESLTEKDEFEEMILQILKIKEMKQDFKIGLVIPTDNLRATMKKCFREINGLNAKMVLSPNDVVKLEDQYDLLIVDEAHRLRRRKNIMQFKTFDQNNKKLELGKTGTELDWILLKSKYQIIFYDHRQSIKPTDIRKKQFDELIHNPKNHLYYLNTQLRCLLGGKEYVDYIYSIFSDHPPKKKVIFQKYDFKIFDQVNDMTEDIKKKNKKYGLCRNVAGFAWKWKSKGKKLPMHLSKKLMNQVISKDVYDIEIDGYRYLWNTQVIDWINSKNAINEIGSIHTVQGYDLNYIGLIIGNELCYDLENEKFYVNRKEYYDIKGKASTTDEELLEYLLNIYSTMCLRGMLGTYLYVCDNGLKTYLKRYVSINKIKK